MKLEEGKRYITREGRLTSPLKFEFKGSGYDYTGGIDGYRFSWLNDGTFDKGRCSAHDLVKEHAGVVEPVSGGSDDSSRVFETGSKRDSAEGKPRVADLKPYTRLRFGYHMLLGSEKYGEGNFELGQPDKSSLESIHRHLAMYELGDRSEDHLSAILFGVQLIMQNEQREGVEPDHYYIKLKK